MFFIVSKLLAMKFADLAECHLGAWMEALIDVGGGVLTIEWREKCNYLNLHYLKWMQISDAI